MAKPIKETPILEGKDAKVFISKMNTSAFRKLSVSEKNRIQSNFKKISAISKF